MDPTGRSASKAGNAILSTILLILVLGGVGIPSAAGAGGVAPPVTLAAASTVLPTNVTGILTINPSLFQQSVPSTATVGGNYTLRIQIQSTANITLPVIVRIVAPVSQVFVHPLLLRTSVPAMGSITANFTMVPFVIWHAAPINVTAAVWVWFTGKMPTPELFDQSSAYIYNIDSSPFPYLPVLLIFGAVVTVVLIVVFYPNLVRRRAPDDGPGPTASTL